MHISSISMEGFKCYEEKTVIKNLDKSFNAITGMNGSGKSNIIDAIIFCLDLDTARSMRASSLKELINIHRKQAAVTLSLENVPSYGNVELTRILSTTKEGVTSKFKLNNSNCTKTTVVNLTKSMEISNDFIILQGHITKVINMKPKELKLMVEETAGTKIYNEEHKKSLMSLEKKELQLKIAQNHLQQRIGPYFSQLESEKKVYLKNQQLEEVRNRKKEELNILIEKHRKIIEKFNFTSLRGAFKKYTETCEMLENLREIDEISVPEIKLQLERNRMILNDFNTVDLQRNTGKIDDIKKSLINLHQSLIACKIKTAHEEENEKLLENQLLSEGGKKQLKDLEFLKKYQNTLEIGYKKIQIDNLIEKYAEKYKFRNKTDQLEIIENLKAVLENSAEATERARKKTNQVQEMRQKLGYDAENDGIHGIVEELFEIENEIYSEAVFTILGGRSKFLVVEDDKVAVEILNKTINKVSCIPLNRIIKSTVQSNGGKKLVDCIKYDKKYRNVFNFLFGSYFVFENKKDAANCCSKNRVFCVTLDGTIYDPRGTLTGGRSSNIRGKIVRKKEILQLEKEIGEEIKFIEENMGIKIGSGEIGLELLEKKITECKKALELKQQLLGNKNKIIFLEGILESKIDVRKELERVSEAVAESRKQKTVLEEEIMKKEEILEKCRKEAERCEEMHEEARIAREEIDELERKLRNSSKKEERDKNEVLRENIRSRTELLKIYKSINSDEKNEQIILECEIPKILLEKNVEVSEREIKLMEEMEISIEKLKEEVKIKKGRITMDPGNFQLLEKNSLIVEELIEKIKQLEEDKLKIEQTMGRLCKMGENEIKKAFSHVSSSLNKILKYFLPDLEAEIDGKTFEIKVRSKFTEFTLGELSGGQRSIIALCLIFAMLSYKPAPFYIFDEIDAALDLSFTQHIGEIIKNEFKNAQFIVVSLKNNMFDNANRVFKVFIEDHKSRIKRVT
ncbi:hypothetical protein NUSPORA_00513 [Nucleospora cyclopteri]